MAAATGTAEIDFGAAPGSNEANVIVTGQADIGAGSNVEAFFMADDFTADHTDSDHAYAPTLMGLTCGTVVAGTGFTINARSHHKLTGRWAVRWVWAD